MWHFLPPNRERLLVSNGYVHYCITRFCNILQKFGIICNSLQLVGTHVALVRSAGRRVESLRPRRSFRSLPDWFWFLRQGRPSPPCTILHFLGQKKHLPYQNAQLKVYSDRWSDPGRKNRLNLAKKYRFGGLGSISKKVWFGHFKLIITIINASSSDRSHGQDSVITNGSCRSHITIDWSNFRFFVATVTERRPSRAGLPHKAEVDDRTKEVADYFVGK